MLAARLFGRALLAAAKSESTGAAAAAGTAVRGAVQNPLEQFFEADRSVEDDKPVVYGKVRNLFISGLDTDFMALSFLLVCFLCITRN